MLSRMNTYAAMNEWIPQRYFYLFDYHSISVLPIPNSLWLKPVTCHLIMTMVGQALIRVSKVSDHRLIFCTRKIYVYKFTSGAHKYLKFRSIKNCTVDSHKDALKQLHWQRSFRKTESRDDLFKKFKKFRLNIDKQL